MRSIRAVPILRGIFGRSEPDETPFQCASCGTQLAVRYQQCPECGSFSIDRADWLDGE
ncbi:Zinc finger protein [Halanaeroarchaeum sp. HSR-CO]|nr:Zinc finger protein [Halanaeroarchaeum sp. HSR-CO]